MSEPSPNSPLRQKALDYLSQQYLKVCTQPLDPEQVEFRIEPEFSRLLIVSRAYTQNNEVGQFRGQFSIQYTKADLQKVLPAPLEVVTDYPIRYKDLCAYLLERYSIVLEDNEFSLVTLVGNPTPGDSVGKICSSNGCSTPNRWMPALLAGFNYPRCGPGLQSQSRRSVQVFPAVRTQIKNIGCGI